MLRNVTLAIMIFGLLAMVSGCSKSTSTDDDAYADFGGLTPTDEAPAFNDPLLLADGEADKAYDDPLLDSNDVDTTIEVAEENGTYALRIIWGSMEYDSTITEITDWSGSLTVSRGAEVIRRTIAFEDGQDYIVPRTDRELIEWVSFTTVHHDGIFVNLYIPPVDTTDSLILYAPVTVEFTTGPFSITFNIDDLVALDTIYDLDDSVNSVSFRGFKINPLDCPKGFMEGYWGKDSTGQGVFKGRWISQHGFLAGYVQGYWGTDLDSNATNMFYGKWVDINGQFEGFLKGQYKNHPMTSNSRNYGGWIRGDIFNADRLKIGALHGHYKKVRCDCDGRMGLFGARWKTFCPRTADTIEPDDGIED
ncbi:MAG: hypothetical protein ABIJ45_10490 [Candidatus Zixiibacteriota bacterium]